MTFPSLSFSHSRRNHLMITVCLMFAKCYFPIPSINGFMFVRIDRVVSLSSGLLPVVVYFMVIIYPTSSQVSYSGSDFADYLLLSHFRFNITIFLDLPVFWMGARHVLLGPIFQEFWLRHTNFSLKWVTKRRKGGRLNALSSQLRLKTGRLSIIMIAICLESNPSGLRHPSSASLLKYRRRRHFTPPSC